MGLFDPPHINIRAKMPEILHLSFDETQVMVRRALMHLTIPCQDLAVATIMSVWSLRSNDTIYAGLNDKSRKYILNMGNNCHARLNEIGKREVERVLEALTEIGSLPHPKIEGNSKQGSVVNEEHSIDQLDVDSDLSNVTHKVEDAGWRHWQSVRKVASTSDASEIKSREPWKNWK